MTAAVVLAAGASRRLGRPKQTVVLGGEMLVERAARVAIEAGLSPVVVVLQDIGLLDKLKAVGAEVLLNRRWFEGMATSIVAGVGWANQQGVDGIVIMTCDQVCVTADHLRSLCAAAARRTGSAYAGRVGIPAYFPAADFGLLLELRRDTGARQLLESAAAVACEELALDVDTEEDLERARQWLEQTLPPDVI